MPAVTRRQTMPPGHDASTRMPRDLTTRGLTLRVDSIDDAARSVEAVLSTEAPTPVFDFQRYEVIDEVLLASGLRSSDQVPMLETHQRYSLDGVLGSIRNIASRSDQVVGRLFFADGDDRAEAVYNKVRQGHITDVSVGYRSSNFVDIPPGKTQRIGGKVYTAATRTLRITTEWKLREVSLVPIGADEFAKIREEAGIFARDTQENYVMNEKLRAYLEQIGLRAEASETDALAYLGQLDGNQKRGAEALRDQAAGESATEMARSVDAETASPTRDASGDGSATAVPHATRIQAGDPVVDVDAVTRAAAISERRRAAEIREMAGSDVEASIIDRAINEGVSPDQASRMFLENMRSGRTQSVGTGPAIHSRSHEADCTVRALEVGMQLRAGLSVIDPDATESRQREQERLAEQGERYAQLSMFDVCREALRVSHVTVPHGREETIRAAVSTGALTNIFSAVVNKQLLTSYAEAPDTTAPFVRHVDLADFKNNERSQLGKTGSLEKLPRGGTATDATIGDRMEQYKLARYAKKFSVDDQDIIDDDMNALLNMPREMGAAAARLLGDLVYSILMGNPTMGDGVALFHTSHGNMAAGAAFARGTLKTALTAMATQQYDSVNLGIFGKAVVVPHALRFDAKELIRSQEVRPAGNTDREIGNFNVLADEGLGIISDSRLDNGVTDPATGSTNAGSATTWYAAASGGRHTIEVGHLRGTGRSPTIRSYVLDRGQYGIGWDIKSDIAAKALDWRGFYRGTA